MWAHGTVQAIPRGATHKQGRSYTNIKRKEGEGVLLTFYVQTIFLVKLILTYRYLKKSSFHLECTQYTFFVSNLDFIKIF